MAQETKTLLIVTVDKKVSNFLRIIINNIIGGKVKVYGQCLDELGPRNIEPDVIMPSGPFLLPKLRKLFPNRRIIAPRRIITGYNLEKVLMLKRGTRALVVNHPRFATEDTIEALKNLGITHIEYVPYWKGVGAGIGDIDTAISPGMAHLCPEHISRVIDIGPRIISIYSFLQLLIALELDLSYLENYATYYHNFLMESSRKLAEVLEHSELLRNCQEVILNQFEDGLLSVNEAGEVEIANNSAARLFKQSKDSLLSVKISELLSGFKHRASLKTGSRADPSQSAVYDYDGGQVLALKIPVSGENTLRHIYTFREIARIQRLEKDLRLRLARKGYVTKYGFDDIWTRNGAIQDLKERAASFALTDKNILITGESGTGKELFAHAIHGSSSRSDGPFVAVNFAGIPESLIESELFGYEPGAFTGAQKKGKPGLFEQAHGGTIFLDEIGDAPPNVQSRLLRVLQEREIMKVGADRIIPIDVRIVAGTNKDLREAMREKRFRSDLFYRLNTLPLEIPPLREHREDILFVLERHLRERCGVARDFTDAAMERLTRYGWPGNTRELLNLAEYVVISTRHKTSLDLCDLPGNLRDSHRESEPWLLDRITGGDLQAAMRTLEQISLAPAPAAALLKTLRDRMGRPTGRLSLMRALAKNGYQVSEGVMKRYLRDLRDRGFIHVGSTKQGTSLTPMGEAVLEVLSGN